MKLNGTIVAVLLTTVATQDMGDGPSDPTHGIGFMPFGDFFKANGCLKPIAARTDIDFTLAHLGCSWCTLCADVCSSPMPPWVNAPAVGLCNLQVPGLPGGDPLPIGPMICVETNPWQRCEWLICRMQADTSATLADAEAWIVDYKADPGVTATCTDLTSDSGEANFGISQDSTSADDAPSTATFEAHLAAGPLPAGVTSTGATTASDPADISAAKAAQAPPTPAPTPSDTPPTPTPSDPPAGTQQSGCTVAGPTMMSLSLVLVTALTAA